MMLLFSTKGDNPEFLGMAWHGIPSLLYIKKIDAIIMVKVLTPLS
jgi:hypothetical protein